MESYRKCLQNKRVYLLGDSTTRQWFEKGILTRLFNCSYVTENWTTDKWHKPSECFSKEINLTVGWYPHSQPFSVGQIDENSYTLYSIARRIDDIDAHEDAVVVIGLFLHVVPYHHNVFKTKMVKIRSSVEKVLERNSNVKIFIKAPHTYTETPAGSFRLNDYFAYVYTNIMYDVFLGLHDRVIFLNNMDTADALRLKWNHPPPEVVKVMVDQMLSYVC